MIHFGGSGRGRRGRRPGFLAALSLPVVLLCACSGPSAGPVASVHVRQVADSPATSPPGSIGLPDPAQDPDRGAGDPSPEGDQESTGPAWDASVARTMPPDLPSPPMPGACAAATRPGWLAAENRRRGTPLPRPPAFAHPGAVLATTSTPSVGCGERFRVAVSAPRGRYAVRVWRTGHYGGAGARVVWTSPTFAAGPQPRTTGAAVVSGGPRWRTTETVTVPATWPPGLYLAEVIGSRTGGAGWVPFVVRGQSDPEGRAPAVYVVPTLTWAAYNPYGGASLYRSSSGPAATAVKRRAHVVALDRPLVQTGQGQLTDYTVPLVQSVEAAGTDVDYVSDVDVDAAPSLLSGRGVVVVGSHAEYVTTRLYDALEAARNEGVNLAFLGANQVYWHVRVTRLADGTAVGVELHRVVSEDPARTRSPEDVTTRWRDTPLNRPEAVLVGSQYRGLGVLGPLQVLAPPSWTGWTAGRSLPRAAGGEVDAVSTLGPPAVQILAAGTTRHGKAWIDATATYYVAPSGAAVINTASLFTGCLSQGRCPGLTAPAQTRQAYRALVANVVRQFATPRFGSEHPVVATPRPWLVGAPLARRYGSAATGVVVRADDD